MTTEELIIEIEALENKDYFKNFASNIEKRRAFKKEVRELEIKWKEALFKKYAVEENKEKSELAFSIAWDRGHSEGYKSVEYYFAELSVLIK